MDLYRQHILDHYRQPRNWGLKANVSAQAKVINSDCGDEMTVQLVIQDDVIKDIFIEGKGCAISVAAASLMSDYLKGQSKKEGTSMAQQKIEELLGTKLPPARVGCGMLAVQAVHQILG